MVFYHTTTRRHNPENLWNDGILSQNYMVS